MSAAAKKPSADSAPAENSAPFDALISLSDKLRGKNAGSLSLTDVIGVAETLTSSLQPLLRRIDSTLHAELRGILGRIQSLRADIARVRADDISSNRIPMVGRELSAIVEATEGATNQIMETAEAVLSADASDANYAEVVSGHMMTIFEACSFQDLTGQRVNKVVETIEIIEGRINLLCDMLDMHAIEEEIPEEENVVAAEKRKKDLILNGPADAGEGVNQSDIDKLF